MIFCTLAFSTTLAATLHVWTNSPSPAAPYRDWATAAHTIQDAVDAASAGDTVLVTNGIYATGCRAVGTNLLVNRVAIDRPITLWSANGPDSTLIVGDGPRGANGDGAIRCADSTCSGCGEMMSKEPMRIVRRSPSSKEWRRDKSAWWIPLAVRHGALLSRANSPDSC
jgi:hypothetical protein